MTISSLSGSIPSLADYLANNSKGSSSFTGIGAGTGSTAGNLGGYTGSGGDSISLSPAAQSMMAQNSTGDDGSAAKGEAQKFLLEFFQVSGVELDKLSDDAKVLLLGIGDMVTDMGAVTQDSKIDTMTGGYVQGQRKSYTLQGENERLSFTVQYKNGQPASMTVLQIQGTTATQAVISLSADTSGKLSTINVASTQKQYNQFGYNTATNTAEAVALALYGTEA